MKLTALVGDTPGLRLTDPQTVDRRVELTTQVLALAADLKVPTVTASGGALTHPETEEPSPLAIAALQRIGEFADSCGVFYSLRPSYDSGRRIVRVLDALRCPSIGVCLDPAALVMHGANPLSSIDRFIEQVKLLHVRDATAGLSERTGHETRLGEGEVDLMGLLAVLDAADYHAVWAAARAVSQALQEATGCERVVVIVYGADVPHAHIHLIPLEAGGHLAFPEPQSATTEELAAEAEKIRGLLAG